MQFVNSLGLQALGSRMRALSDRLYDDVHRQCDAAARKGATCSTPCPGAGR